MKIVLLPGLDGTGILFGPFLDRLPASLSPIVVTYPPDRELGYDELLEIVLRHIPAGEPFVLLGESFSGPLALMAAANRPAGLRGVVLCATFVQNPTWIRVPRLDRLVRPFAFRLYPKFSAAKALLGRYSTPELRRQIAQAIGAVRPEVFAHRVRAVLNVQVADKLVACCRRGPKRPPRRWPALPARLLRQEALIDHPVDVHRLLQPVQLLAHEGGELLQAFDVDARVGVALPVGVAHVDVDRRAHEAGLVQVALRLLGVLE
ncbi:MAG TPA: hypothetical protein VF211_00370, partial [Burkholderiales bacterium]